MSNIKRFLENLSMKEGYKGEINKQILSKAEKFFNKKSKVKSI
jgi:hypothetical protein